MAKRVPVDKSVRMTIIKLFKQNLSIRVIGDQVRRSKSVIVRIIKEYKDNRFACCANKKARLRKTSKREYRIIQRCDLKDRFASAASISRQVNEPNNMCVSRLRFKTSE